jgi:hypothetical protein
MVRDVFLTSAIVWVLVLVGILVGVLLLKINE